MRRRWRAIALGVALLGVCAAAAPESAGTRRKVQGHLDRAAKLFGTRDFNGALAELQAAEKLTDLAVVRYNVARCFEELGRGREALDAYESYLTLADTTSGADERRARATKASRQLEAKLFGSLAIRCSVATAKLTVAHLVETPQPCPLEKARVAPGSYEVEATAAGFLPATVAVQVKAGERAELPLQLIPVPPPLPAAKDEVVAAAPTTPDVRVAPKAEGGHALAWGLWGAGGAAAGSAVLFGVLGSRQNAVIQGGGLPSGATIEQQAGLGRTYNTVAVVSGALGVAALAGGAVAWFWPKRPAEVSVAPLAGPGTAGVSVSGTLDW